MIRLGFTGAQGTGKTTLAQDMQKDGSFGGVARTLSAARLAAQHGVDINRNADPLSQLLITIANINKDLMHFEGLDYVISERTPLDTLAYTRYQLENQWDDLDFRIKSFYWESSKILSMTHLGMYDKLLYFPPYFEPQADGGTRDTDRDYQMEIDLILKGVIDEYDVKVLIVPDLDPQERLEWAKEVLNA